MKKIGAFVFSMFLLAIVVLSMRAEDGWTMQILQGDPDILRIEAVSESVEITVTRTTGTANYQLKVGESVNIKGGQTSEGVVKFVEVKETFYDFTPEGQISLRPTATPTATPTPGYDLILSGDQITLTTKGGLVAQVILSDQNGAINFEVSNGWSERIFPNTWVEIHILDVVRRFAVIDGVLGEIFFTSSLYLPVVAR